MKKLKGCSKAVKMKYLIFVFIAAVFVALPTRVYQLLALVNQERGFFEKTDITVPVLYGVSAFFVISFLVLSFISKEVPSPKLPTGKNPVLGIASIVMTVGLLWDILAVIKSIVPAYSDGAESFAAMLQINFEQSGGVLAALQIVFAIFAIFYTLIFSISHLNGVASYKEYKILALAPVCWAIVKLIGKLMNAVSFITVSELLFEIFMFVFATLFLLTFARISTGVFTEDNMWGIFGYGFAAAFFAALVTVPRIVCIVVSYDAVEGHPFSVSDFSLLIFTLSYILASLGIGFKDGLKNRRAAEAIKLPDDVVVKRDKAVQTEEIDVLEALGMADEQEEEFVYEEAFPQADEEVFFEDVMESEEPVEEVVEEEIFEAPVEEVVEEEIFEAPVEEVVEEEIFEAPVEEVVEEEIFEAPVEEVVEEEIFEAPVEEVVEEEILEAPVEEVVEEEIFEAPVEEVVEEEIFEAPVEEVVEEEIFEEPVEEVVEEEIFEAPIEKVIDDGILEESVEEGIMEDDAFQPVDIVEEAVEEKSKKEPKPKKEKKSLFGKKKKQEEVKEEADDLKPISLADLKKNNEQ